MAAPQAVNPERLLPPTWKNLFYPPEENEYSYFAHATEHPFSEPIRPGLPFNPAKAAWAADAAMLAYGRFGRQPIPEATFRSILNDAGFTDCQLIGDWSTSGRGTQGCFASNPDFAILAFRGTERDDPSDSLTDLDARPSSEQEFESGLQRSSLLHMFEDAADSLLHGCVVHHGFQQALNQVWSVTAVLLSSYRSRQPNAEICFTGHSLGAALATLAISRFRGEAASLYTIGSPRVGNDAFCRRVHERATLGVFRFVDNNDLVTHVPIQAPIYDHVEKQCYRFDDTGKLSVAQAGTLSDVRDLAQVITELAERWHFQDLDALAPSRLADHSPARYCMRIRNYLAASTQQVVAQAAGS